MITVLSAMFTPKTKHRHVKPKLDAYGRQEFNQRLRKILFCSSLTIVFPTIFMVVARRSISLTSLLFILIPPVVLYIIYLFVRKPRVQ